VIFCKQSDIAALRQWYIFPAGKCFGSFSPVSEKRNYIKNVIKERYKRLSQGGSFAHPKFLKVLKAFLKGVQAGIKGAKPLKNPEMR
jgi:hypothetical protein